VACAPKTGWHKGGVSTILPVGVLAWAHPDPPLVNNGRPIRTVHVYSLAWSMLPEGYAPVRARILPEGLPTTSALEQEKPA